MNAKSEFMDAARTMNAMLEGFWKDMESDLDEMQKQILTDLGKDLCRFLEVFGIDAK